MRVSRRFPGIWMMLALAAGLAGQVSADGAVDRGQRLEFPGFSLEPPAGPRWTQVRRDSRSVVWMRRQSDPAHSFSVAVLTGPLPGGTGSAAAFEAWVRHSKFTSPDPERFVILDSNLGRRTGRTDDCLDYRLRAEDRGGGTVMALEVAGLACRHPDAPDRYFDVQHSERRPADSEGPSPRAEGVAFVDGFRFAAPPADGNWNLAPGRAPDPPREAT